MQGSRRLIVEFTKFMQLGSTNEFHDALLPRTTEATFVVCTRNNAEMEALWVVREL